MPHALRCFATIVAYFMLTVAMCVHMAKANGNSLDVKIPHGTNQFYYQQRDEKFITYDAWELPGTRHRILRGPSVSPTDIEKGHYFTTIGAAETFGCFAQKPYPTLVSAHIGLPCLNFGRGGAGPAYFNNPDNDDIIELANHGLFVVISVMSSRQASNTLFSSKQGGYTVDYKGLIMTADAAWKSIVDENWGSNKQDIGKLIEESRDSYVREYHALFRKIKVPILLFYFSRRQPDYTINWATNHVSSLSGDAFPQFVDQSTINRILEAKPTHYATCVSKRGWPQPLYLKSDTLHKKLPIRTNRYYPSPEMHEDAAGILYPICQSITNQMRSSLK